MNQQIINTTLQLQKEYDHICYQYNLKLKRPIILIENLADAFGKWDSDRRIIFIAESLIYKYSWDKVLSVLKHEMAHQIVSEVYRTNDTHGETFVRAAQALGLEAQFTKVQLCLEEDLFEWKQQTSTEEEQSILRKVEKLMSLSSSSNEHEAYLAMAKVREIYKRYNLSRLFNHAQKNNVSLTIYLNVKRVQSTVFYISNILQEHYFVSTIFTHTYCPQTNNEYRCFVIMGEKHNVLMAEYVYEYLKQQIEHLWKTYQKENRLKAKFKGSYQKGILEGFSEKLNSLKTTQATEMPAQEKALMLTFQSELAQYVRTQFPKTTSSHQSGLIYKDHYDRGSQEGKKMTLSKPITQRSSGLLRFLTSGARK